ncbi:hypothetical protein LJK87_00410 [Paenibacillus sp. P25]|nr:hypothetical protein LJK87_00410 [Paenibacillus sp. P25]
MIVRFADYGFPRAHATAYGVLAYQTAYLKAHYPVQFMASMLTAVMGSHNKVAEYVEECRRMGIPVLPPDVNESGYVFTPLVRGSAGPAPNPEGADAAAAPADDTGGKRPAIRFGLAAIKNVGTHAIESIISERRTGPYTSLIDLCRRVDLRVCNKRVLESLIQGGALDSLPGHRAQQLAMLEDAVEAAVKWRKNREDLQLVLEGFVEEANWEVEYPEIAPFTMTQRLELERELLGLYITGSPLDDYEEVLRRLELDPLHLLGEYPDYSEVMVAGLVLSNKTIVTKKGQPMAFMELEDRVGEGRGRPVPGDLEEICPAGAEGQTCARAGQAAARRRGLQAAGGSTDCPERSALGSEGGSSARRPAGGDTATGWGPGRRPAGGNNAGRFAPPDGAAGRTAGSAAPSGTIQAAPEQPARPEQAAGTPAAHRVYMRISPQHEQPEVLERLKRLIARHRGPSPVVLFYEKSHKSLGLSEKFNISPSPELIREVESLLGKDSVKVK